MRTITTLLVAAGLLFAAAGPATASINIYLDPTVGDTVSFTGGAGYNNRLFHYNGSNYYGGPFIGALNTTATWTTFCVEADGGSEDIHFYPATYEVSNLDPHVAIATQNYVTDQAKWLYWEYGNGSLPAILVNNETWNVNDLQLAIWHGVLAHGVPGSPLAMLIYSGGNYVDAYANTTAAQDLYGLAETALGGADPLEQAKADSVWVLNPATTGGTQAQSMLYAIPEPGTIIIWSLLGAGSWLGMRVWRRRGGPVGRQPWSNENRTAIHDIIAHGTPR